MCGWKCVPVRALTCSHTQYDSSATRTHAFLGCSVIALHQLENGVGSIQGKHCEVLRGHLLLPLVNEVPYLPSDENGEIQMHIGSHWLCQSVPSAFQGIRGKRML